MAIFAVAVFAIPTGIIGSEFQSMIDERRKEKKLVAASNSTIVSSSSSSSTSMFSRCLRSNAFQILTLILVLGSTISFFLSTCLRFQESSSAIFVLNAFEICCVFVFAVEYLIRSISDTSSYITTSFGMIDLLSFLPTLIGFHVTGTIHSTVFWRSLRLLRLLKAERMLRSFSVFYVVFRDNSEIFMVLVFVMMLMWLFCSTLMYYAERNNPDWSMARYYQSIPGAMWVTLLNLTGESPLCDFTFFGKMVTAFMGIFGVGVFAIPIGLFGAAWEDAVSGLDENDDDDDDDDDDETKETTKELVELKDETTKELIELRGEINLRFEIVMKSKKDLYECKKRFQSVFRRELETKRKLNERTALIRREFDITTSLSCSNGSHVFGAVSLSRCFDLSESQVLRSCKSAVIESFDQSDVESVHIDTRQMIGDSMTNRYRIHLFVEGRTRNGNHFLNVVYLLIFMSCCTAIFGTVHEMNRDYGHVFDAIELFSVIVFTVEISLRIYAAPELKMSRFSYLISFYSLVDLIAVVPYYLAFFSPALDRYDEKLRMLRILRLLKLKSAVLSINLLGSAIRSKRDALFVATFDTIVLWCLFTALLYLSELDDFVHGPDGDDPTQAFRYRNAPNALEYTMIHLTGDFPLIDYTLWGRVVCFLIVFAAVGVTSVPQGLIANGFTETLQETRSRTRRRKVHAAITIERVLRGFVQRMRFEKLVRKVKAIKRIEVAMESQDVDELLSAVRDARSFVSSSGEKSGDRTATEKKKKKTESQFELTKSRVENQLREKFERAKQLVIDLENTKEGVKRRATIESELKSWKERYSPRHSERKRRGVSRASRMRSRRLSNTTMSEVYEIVRSETTSNFVMILILFNLVLVLVESVRGVRARIFFFTDSEYSLVSLTSLINSYPCHVLVSLAQKNTTRMLRRT